MQYSCISYILNTLNLFSVSSCRLLRACTALSSRMAQQCRSPHVTSSAHEQSIQTLWLLTAILSTRCEQHALCILNMLHLKVHFFLITSIKVYQVLIGNNLHITFYSNSSSVSIVLGSFTTKSARGAKRGSARQVIAGNHIVLVLEFWGTQNQRSAPLELLPCNVRVVQVWYCFPIVACSKRNGDEFSKESDVNVHSLRQAAVSTALFAPTEDASCAVHSAGGNSASTDLIPNVPRWHLRDAGPKS